MPVSVAPCSTKSYDQVVDPTAVVDQLLLGVGIKVATAVAPEVSQKPVVVVEPQRTLAAEPASLYRRS